MFADDSGEMSAANFKIVRFFLFFHIPFRQNTKLFLFQAMRALPKICGFPTSEEVTRALKMVCLSLSLSLTIFLRLEKLKMKTKKKKQQYGGSGGRVNVSSYIRVMTERASKCGDFDSELRKLGNNPFEKLKSGGDIKTVGTLIDVLCSRNKDTKESFTKQEMKTWQEASGFYLGGQNSAYDAAEIYKKSIELLKREG